MASFARRFLAIALLSVLTAAAGCGGSDGGTTDAGVDKGSAGMDTKPADGAGGTGGGAGSQPSIIITAPANSSTVTAANINVVYTVLNFTLKTAGTCAGATACGHVQVLVDGTACNDTPGGKPYNNAGIASPIEVKFGLCPMVSGTHIIVLELHKDDGTAYRNAANAIISDKVTVTVSVTGTPDAGDAPRDTMSTDVRDTASDMKADAGTDADAPRDADAAPPTDVPVETPPADATDSAVEAAQDTPVTSDTAADTAPDTGSDSRDSGGSDAGTSDATDSGGTTFAAVAPCNAEADYTAGTTTITFGSAQVYAPKCLKVAKGSTVTFQGSFSNHPLRPSASRGTTTGNPIAATSGGTSMGFTFSNSGYFAYFCSEHGAADNGTGMAGVIWVP